MLAAINSMVKDSKRLHSFPGFATRQNGVDTWSPGPMLREQNNLDLTELPRSCCWSSSRLDPGSRAEER